MVPSIWLIVAFAAGIAVGALIVSVHRASMLSRIRDEFKAELQALTESRAESSNEPPPERNHPHKAA